MDTLNIEIVSNGLDSTKHQANTHLSPISSFSAQQSNFTPPAVGNGLPGSHTATKQVIKKNNIEFH